MLNDRLKRRIAEALAHEAARDALADVLRKAAAPTGAAVLADDEVDPLLRAGVEPPRADGDADGAAVAEPPQASDAPGAGSDDAAGVSGCDPSLHAILDHVRDAILTVDRGGRVLCATQRNHTGCIYRSG